MTKEDIVITIVAIPFVFTAVVGGILGVLAVVALMNPVASAPFVVYALMMLDHLL